MLGGFLQCWVTMASWKPSRVSAMTSASVPHTWGFLLAMVLGIQGAVGLSFDRLELITFTQVCTTTLLSTSRESVESRPDLTFLALSL